MTISEKIKSELRRYLEENSIRSVESATGVDIGTLVRWLQDDGRDPRASTLDALAEFLGVETKSRTKKPTAG